MLLQRVIGNPLSEPECGTDVCGVESEAQSERVLYAGAPRRAVGTGELGWWFFCSRVQPGFETQELERDALRCIL